MRMMKESRRTHGKTWLKHSVICTPGHQLVNHTLWLWRQFCPPRRGLVMLRESRWREPRGSRICESPWPFAHSRWGVGGAQDLSCSPSGVAGRMEQGGGPPGGGRYAGTRSPEWDLAVQGWSYEEWGFWSSQKVGSERRWQLVEDPPLDHKHDPWQQFSEENAHQSFWTNGVRSSVGQLVPTRWRDHHLRSRRPEALLSHLQARICLAELFQPKPESSRLGFWRWRF